MTATNFYGTDDYCEDVTIMNVGIEDVALDNSIEMFPNPTAGEVNVTIANSTLENVTISVFNIIGEQVLENVEMNLKANNKANIDLSNLDAGNYFVKFQSENAVATRQITLSK